MRLDSVAQVLDPYIQFPLSELSGILGGGGYVDDEATFALHQSREVL